MGRIKVVVGEVKICWCFELVIVGQQLKCVVLVAGLWLLVVGGRW